MESNQDPKKTSDAATQPFTVNGQYVRDFSFENPNAPASLFGQKAQPNINLSIDLKARNLQKESYELVMKIQVEAKSEDQALFIIELDYAGVFTLNQVPEDQREGLILVDGAYILFPFARRIIADAVRDGGFPPLMLEPIDFKTLYRRRKAVEQDKAKKQAMN